ncbi:MAG: hypothetical protein L0312_07155, partial [Acidobacteria bacterium]|nr:hypothetical protein [Acidobacteriota bacterium]
MRRREFLLLSLAAAARGAAPLKIGHRQANMLREPSPDALQLASRIAGLSGVELQVHMQKQNLCDPVTLLAYKEAA